MEHVYPTVYQDHNNGANTFYHLDPYDLQEKVYSVGHVESLTNAINASTELHHAAWRDGVLDVEEILAEQFDRECGESCGLEYLTSIQYELDREEYVEAMLLRIEALPKLLLHVVAVETAPLMSL
jgi:hypothetical protein